MYPNSIKQKLANGQVVFGTGLAAFSPHIAGPTLGTGIDFLWIDTEHMPYGSEALDTIPVLARQRGVAPMIRVANNDPALISEVERFEQHVGRLFQPMSTWERIGQRWLLLLGTDRQGRSILQRAIYSVKVALQIGLVTALISVACGSLLGAAAAFYGGVIDHVVIWLYSTLSSIPNLVLLVLLAYLFTGTTVEDTHPLIPVYAAFCLTYWIGPCRVVRGETLKIKELEYIQAATTVGFSRFYILLRHILPNTAHLILVNFSLLFIGAVKSEVILSFLGLGVKHGPSWGIMISHAKSEVVNGFFWQIGTATAFMFVLVLAFNILTDALQDAFDPKHL